MKHYMDIDNLREEDIDLGNDMTRPANCGAFELGDRVTIAEKVDGSCASALLNYETGEFEAYSRKQLLTPMQTLNGFYNYVQSLPKEAFIEGMIVFGEWTGAKNKIVYDLPNTKKWYVFDIYDTYSQTYLPWKTVKLWCETHGFEYANILYDGEFKGWEHAKSFLHSPHYGTIQEGIVIKNQDKLEDEDNRLPFYLKIVNDDFNESMKIRKPKALDPDVEKAKALAESYAEQIVTRNRVEKMLTKLRDEGILGSTIEPKDMGIVAKNLPQRIYMDCMKEEPEIVMTMGEYAGKAISTATMRLAREILL